MSVSVVRVTSRRAPTIRWSCSSCGGPRPFECSERFRANANGKRVDIWLIYRCTRCDRTKNLTVVERQRVASVPRALLDAAHCNDAAVARAVARDRSLLRRNGAAVVEGDDWITDGTADRDAILDLPEPLLIRLDTVAAAVLGVSRSVVRAGALEVDAAGRTDALSLWRGPLRIRWAADERPRRSTPGAGGRPAGR